MKTPDAAREYDSAVARANISWAFVVEHLVFAMQAAWIEWKHGGGADKAMLWIENTLDGPDSIPDTDKVGTDAQAFFDRVIAESRQRRTEAEARLNAE